MSDAAGTDLTDLVSSTTDNSNTLYIILAVQVLLLIERIFTNVFKRVKRCKCSECCSVDMVSSSLSLSDSPKKVRRRSVDVEKPDSVENPKSDSRTSGNPKSSQNEESSEYEG